MGMDIKDRTGAENTAAFVRTLTGFRGDARLYRVSPPMAGRSWMSDETATHDYVVVSAADVMFSGPETYIFPADEDGNVVDWGEVDGSFRGALDHERALHEAGYTVVNADVVVQETAPRKAVEA